MVEKYLDLNAFRVEISEKVTTEKYDDLQAEFGVNRYYLWHIIHEPDYKPPAWVYVHLGIGRHELAPVCPIHGIVEQYDCRTQVVRAKPKPRQPRARWGWLHDLPKGELLDMLENRQTVI